MRRHVAQPGHSRGFERRVGVEAAGDGVVDDDLALLFQQGDESLFGADVAGNAVVGVVEVADDGGLLVWGRYAYLQATELTFSNGG